MAEGDKVRCLGYFGGQCVPENYHEWGGLYDGSGDRYVPDAPAGELYNVVGPGTDYPVGLSLEQAMKWHWKAKNWQVEGSVAASQSCVQFSQNSWTEADPMVINSSVIQTDSTLAPDSGPISHTFPPSELLTKMKDILCRGRYYSFSRYAGFESPYDDAVGNFYTSERTSYDVVTYTGDGGGGFSVTIPGDVVKVGDLYYPKISASISANLTLYGRFLTYLDALPSPFGYVASVRSKRLSEDYWAMFRHALDPTEDPYGFPPLLYSSHRDVPSAARLTIDGVDIPMFQPPDFLPLTHSFTELSETRLVSFSTGSLVYMANIALTIVDEF